MKYNISNHVSSPPMTLFLKRNHPKKCQVSKRFFLWETSFYKLLYVSSVFFNYRDWVVRKNLPLLSSFLRFDRKFFWIRSTPHYESWIRPWYYRYSFFFNFPAHSIFTFDEFWGSLGTSIFRKSSLAANNIRSNYLPDYLFNSDDYGYTLPLALWYETNAAQRMVVKSDLSLHTRHGFWYFWFQTSALRILWSNCNFSLLLYFDMTLQLLYVKVELFS